MPVVKPACPEPVKDSLSALSFPALFSRLQRVGSLTALGLLLSVGFCLPARADDTLILELPPSQDLQELREAARAAEAAAKESARNSAIPPQYRAPAGQSRGSNYQIASRGSASSRETGANERVVGRLGEVTQQTPIYRSRNTRSPRLSVVTAGTYLAIQQEFGGWFGVLMADGSLGWLRRQSVKVLDYEVTSNGAPPSPARPSSGNYNYSDGFAAGNRPYFQSDPQALFREAYKYLGVPYHWGGNTGSGIDCSGLVHNVFATCGYPLPRHSGDQVAYGIAVPKDQLSPGDRLYFGHTDSRGVTHTALYLGNGYFIHASSSKHGVIISHLNESLYQRIYLCARR